MTPPGLGSGSEYPFKEFFTYWMMVGSSPLLHPKSIDFEPKFREDGSRKEGKLGNVLFTFAKSKVKSSKVQALLYLLNGSNIVQVPLL